MTNDGRLNLRQTLISIIKGESVSKANIKFFLTMNYDVYADRTLLHSGEWVDVDLCLYTAKEYGFKEFEALFIGVLKSVEVVREGRYIQI